MLNDNTYKLKNLSGLAELANWLLKKAENRKVFAFYGSMGAGKTTLIKEICKQLQVTDVVTSPTFALINEYHLAMGSSLFHFDFYRIKNLSEAFDLGYEDYFASNKYCFIEWAEKIEELLPENTLRIYIETQVDNSRKIDLKM